MSKIYSKEPKHFTLVKGVEVVKIVFTDDSITSVVLKDNTRVDFGNIHKKTAKRLMEENMKVPTWTLSTAEEMEIIDMKMRKTMFAAKKKKVKVIGLNKDRYSVKTKKALTKSV